MPAAHSSIPRSKPVLILFGAIIGITLLIGIVATFSVKPDMLFMHCDLALKSEMPDIVAAYLRETGVQVELHLGTSEELLKDISERRRGDLFLPANESYISRANEKNLLIRTFPLPGPVTARASKGNSTRVQVHNSPVDAPIAISILKCSPNPKAAEKFARYVAGLETE